MVRFLSCSFGVWEVPLHYFYNQVHLLYTHMQMHAEHNNDDTIKTSGHSSLENIPLTLLKGLCVRGS